VYIGHIRASENYSGKFYSPPLLPQTVFVCYCYASVMLILPHIADKVISTLTLESFIQQSSAPLICRIELVIYLTASLIF